MNAGIVATVPLGVLILIAVILLLTSLVAGWYAASIRWRRRLIRSTQVNESRLRALLHALPFAALVVDASGEIIIRNEAATGLLSSFGRGNTVPLTIDAAVGRVIHSGAAETLELRQPGSDHSLQLSISPVGSGETAASVSLNAGVSCALILVQNAALPPARARVYQQLISAVGHELRTPLTAVMGHVDIIGSCTVEEEALRQRSLTFVTAEVERLARLVEDLLRLSRLDLAPYRLRPTNLRLIAEEAVSTLFDKAVEHNVTLILEATHGLPRVQADPDRIRQVFLNLLDNAIKYAPNSVVTIHIESCNSAVQVEIRDTGPGIPAGEQAYIFAPFHRSNHNGAVSGTGLGLTIVKSILEQHNAPIRVESQPGEGAQFTFFLAAE